MEAFFFRAVGCLVALFDQLFDLGGDVLLFGFGLPYFGYVIFVVHFEFHLSPLLGLAPAEDAFHYGEKAVAGDDLAKE